MKLLKKIGVVAVIAAMLATTVAFVACDPNEPGPGSKVTITGLQLVMEAENTTYISGDVFDPTGIILRVTYSDNTSENITAGFDYDTEPLEVGDTSVTITYEGKTVTQAITVSDAGDALIVCFGSGDKTRCYGDGTVLCGGQQIDPYIFKDGDDSSLANLVVDKAMLAGIYNVGTWSWDGEEFKMTINNKTEDVEVEVTYNEETGLWVMSEYGYVDGENRVYPFGGSCTKEQAEKYITADRTWPVERAE